MHIHSLCYRVQVSTYFEVNVKMFEIMEIRPKIRGQLNRVA